ASAAARLGWPARASCTSASSCGSPNAVHQSRESADTRPADDSVADAARLSASVGRTCVSRSCVLAQPASASARNSGVRRRAAGATGRGVMSVGIGREVVADAAQQLDEVRAFGVVETVQRALVHAAAAVADVAP